MASIHVEIVSAEGHIFSGDANLVICPAKMGDVGIAPRHAPLMTMLRPGEVRVQAEGKDEVFLYVTGGILEVQPNRVTVLADTAIRGHDLDEAKAEEAKRAAEEALANRTGAIDYAKAQAELAAAIAQLAALRKFRQRK